MGKDKVEQIIDLINDGIDYEVEDGRVLDLSGRALDDTKYHLRKILEE